METLLAHGQPIGLRLVYGYFLTAWQSNFKGCPVAHKA